MLLDESTDVFKSTEIVRRPNKRHRPDGVDGVDAGFDLDDDAFGNVFDAF